MQRVGEKTKIYSAAGTVLAVDQTPAELLTAAEMEPRIAGSLQEVRIAQSENDASLDQ